MQVRENSSRITLRDNATNFQSVTLTKCLSLKGAYSGSYHAKMGLEIIKKFRSSYVPAKKHKRDPNLRPTFTEFVKFVLDCAGPLGSSSSSSKDPASSSTGPAPLDMHWTPAWSFCNVCQVQFTDIVLLETFERDQVI